MTRITDEDMFIAAVALAETVPQDRLDASCTYPSLGVRFTVTMYYL
jgi:hypothetical protein